MSDQEEIVTSLLDMVKQIQQQNHELMSKVLDGQSQHNEMMAAWFSMFKPQGDNSSSAMLTRDTRKELAEASEYEPLNFDPLEELMRDD
jgi:hypothetical protein